MKAHNCAAVHFPNRPCLCIDLILLQWEGSGGMQKCEGTSAEQALKNQAIRDRLTNHSDVVALFTIYTLEDGSIVKIDKQLAFDRVRTCMNTLKKTRGCSLNPTSADANKENEHEVSH